ncbi:hypothetical protein VNO77_27350 [Canavalia gladiata]|uniref:Uncharacterized protein n=1 Tax=Canavalia gladiata TaxID=3824 RepID=A0AAN9Q708_CANGL
MAARRNREDVHYKPGAHTTETSLWLDGIFRGFDSFLKARSVCVGDQGIGSMAREHSMQNMHRDALSRLRGYLFTPTFAIASTNGFWPVERQVQALRDMACIYLQAKCGNSSFSTLWSFPKIELSKPSPVDRDLAPCREELMKSINVPQTRISSPNHS